MKLKHRIEKFFETKEDKKQKKLLKDYEEKKFLKIGGEVNSNKDGK